MFENEITNTEKLSSKLSKTNELLRYGKKSQYFLFAYSYLPKPFLFCWTVIDLNPLRKIAKQKRLVHGFGSDYQSSSPKARGIVPCGSKLNSLTRSATDSLHY